MVLVLMNCSAYGALDAKLASKDSFLKDSSLEFTAVAGPTHDRHPPFQWSDTNLDLGDVPNFRTIDKFDFQPVRATWNLTGGAQ